MASASSVLAVIRASRPKYRSKADRVVFAIHACMLAAGYRLVAVGARADEGETEKDKPEDDSIEGWNESGNHYSLQYKNESDNTVIMKCLALDDTVMVDATSADGKGEVGHTELRVDDFVNDEPSPDYAKQYKDLEKLVKVIGADILSKLKQPRAVDSSSKGKTASREEAPHYERQVPPTEREALPRSDRNRLDHEEPDFLSGPPHCGPDLRVPPIPAGVGGNDLFPAGGAGVLPPRGGMGAGLPVPGGGMFVGPDHPLFIGQGGYPPHTGIPPGGLPLGVPPGARFDPFGPPGVPGFEPDRFTSDGRRPPGRGPRPPHPDLQFFPGDII